LTSSAILRPASAAAAAVIAVVLSACGSHKHTTTVRSIQSTTTQSTVSLPGTGRPPIMIGDKNYTAQFVLGELYRQALGAQGFTVSLNRNIGPTAVTIQAMQSGRLDLYPEDLQTWNTAVAANTQTYPSAHEAYLAAQRYADAHDMVLLKPTPFSYTDAIAVTAGYANQNGLRTIGDLAKVAPKLTLGAPPQFKNSLTGLLGIQQAYDVTPAGFTPLQLGDQYQALDQGTIQAADVNTTDGELQAGQYRLLGDPKNVFGWGNIVPVVSRKALLAEGPVFVETINRVNALLTAPVMRQLNANVDVAHQDPAAVAKRFLLDTGVITPTPSS
jgi:osmoprotectant transport system substrate-binding protein